MKRFLPVAIVAAIAAWAIVRLAVDPLRCDLALRETIARTALAEAAPSEYETVVLVRENLERLAPWRERCPWSDEVHFTIASNLSLIKRYDDAVDEFREALKYDQRPEYYIALGLALVDAGRDDEAVDAFTTAARFNVALVARHVVREDLRDRIGAKLAEPSATSP